MTKRLAAACVAVALLSLLSAYAAGGGPAGGALNLATNPSFENVEARTGLPVGWRGHVRPELGLVATESLIAHSGQRCVRLRFSELVGPDSSAQLALMGAVASPPLKPNTVYTVSCYVRTRNFTGRAILGLYEYPAPFPKGVRHRVEKRGGVLEWTRLSMTFESRPDLRSFQLRLSGYCPPGQVRGEIWFDDVSVVEGRPKEGGR